ncbi:carboxyltransferase subunit alpha [Liquorilactobacillus nagelii]|uniref:carboxyltransferase subunit alpha n=1 Tax=Liquorilactobacillus nagelii TaxID=82688 RepID=UPI001CCE77A6|nr:carboxyltransferase subunit alpha [Liquorilactobacillus nagelii]ULQ49156.1 acetyl-CoA carboxylase carboxyl transferase subunit alpha [Liquorilactobacillus nagelii]
MASLLDRKKTAAQVVALARSDEKISAQVLLKGIFTEFIEFHGDRGFADDPAIIGGLAYLNEQPVTVIVTNKGQIPEEKLQTHFGCPEPAGYRKALRLAQQAAKFQRPVIFLVNTAGAYPGKSAEENGQGEAIARNLLEFSTLPTPIISVIYGEGGSGGALALACGDRVWMLENSTYSVLSPEGFAAILWKDSSRADEAAEVLQLTPEKLLQQKIIEGIIPESHSQRRLCRAIKKTITTEMMQLQQLKTTQLLEQRRLRFRKF